MVTSGFMQRLQQQPSNPGGLAEKYQALLSALIADGTVPKRVLDLCWERICCIHGLIEQSGLTEPVTYDERIAIRAAEKMPYQHHDLTDAEIDQIRSAFGDQGCVALLTALSFFDVSCRLDQTAKVVWS